MLNVSQLAVASEQGGSELLKPLSFTLRKGEILGVIGESGSGKSILAHAMLGHAPQGYQLRGCVSTSETIALSAQSAAVFDPLRTITQHLSRWRQALSHREGHFDTLGINREIASSYRHQLSGGMAKRACLAQAMIQSPNFILADEPCAGLDEFAAHKAYQQLRTKANADNLGIMIITHNLRQLMKWADRILVLKEGQMVELTTPEAVCQNRCHPYSRSLWEALPENWDKSNANAA